jgi:tyrosine-protein phosphatase SIW14
MRFWLRTHVLAMITVVVSTMWATSQVPHAGNPNASVSPGDRSFAHRLKMKGVSNAGEITPTLFRGAQPNAQGFEALAKLGINIVVDLRGSRESERQRVTKLGMQYVAIPWHCPFPRDDAFARFLTLLRQSPGKKVFVHCRLGDDRSGMAIAAYRMAEQGWTAKEAMNEMQAFGFSLSHHFICPSLSSYEASFPQRFSTSPAFHSLHAPAPSAVP